MKAATLNQLVWRFSPEPSLLAMEYSMTSRPVLVALTSGVPARLPTSVIFAMSRRAEAEKGARAAAAAAAGVAAVGNAAPLEARRGATARVTRRVRKDIVARALACVCVWLLCERVRERERVCVCVCNRGVYLYIGEVYCCCYR